MAKKIAYGGAIFDDAGRVLLRKPRGDYDGYKWTFPKGRPDDGETPEAAALREVLEESGMKAKIVGRVPGSFEGGTTVNHYFLMQPIESELEFDGETAEIRWATPEQAVELISQTTNAKGRKRDLAVLDAAVNAFRALDPVQSLLESLNKPINLLARSIHKLLVELHAGCTPKVCAPKSTPYIRYAPYPDLFHLQISQKSCVVLISQKLSMRDSLDQVGAKVTSRKKWHALKVETDSTVNAFAGALQKHLQNIHAKLESGSPTVMIDSAFSLPTIKLDLDQLGNVLIAWNKSDSSFVGQVFAYRIDSLQDAVIAAKENLDRFLTQQIAKGLQSKPLKKKVLFWFWETTGKVFIGVTKVGPKTNCGWLRDIPGFFDSGQGRIKVIASPFVYWDGHTFYRVYSSPGESSLDDPYDLEGSGDIANYVVDFGSISRLYTVKSSRENYLDIKENREEYWEYSAVPERNEEDLILNGNKYTIHHAFYEFIGEDSYEFADPF